MAAPRKYPQELRDRALRLARESDRPLAQIARDLGVHKEALRTWVRQDEADSGERDDRLSTVEREELARLRQEVKELRRANEILREASVYVGDVCQVPVASSRSMSPSKIFLRSILPLWRCRRVGLARLRSRRHQPSSDCLDLRCNWLAGSVCRARTDTALEGDREGVQCRFHRMADRARPRPVGSSERVT